MAEALEGPKPWHLAERLNPFEEGISNEERLSRFKDFGTTGFLNSGAGFQRVRYRGVDYKLLRGGGLEESPDTRADGLFGSNRGYNIFDFDEAVDYAPGMSGGGYVRQQIGWDRYGRKRWNYKQERLTKQSLGGRFKKYQKRQHKLKLEELERQREEARLADEKRLADIRAKEWKLRETMKQKYTQLYKGKMDTQVADTEKPKTATRTFNRRKWRNISSAARVGGTGMLRRPV
mgnify:CR=1 FL=1